MADVNGLLICICLVMSSGAVMALLHYVISLENKAVLEEKLRDTRNRMVLEQAHYKAVEVRQEELARIRHDFNNQLAVISLLIGTGEKNDAQQMIQQLGKNIDATRENLYCAIPVVNAVLTEKEKTCREKGILLQTELDIPVTLSVEPLHLCSIFSNLVDNAIRGAEGCGQKLSSIHLSSAMAGDYLMIKTINPSGAPQAPQPGHGYGSRTLKELAAQYDGVYQTSYEDGIYTAVVSLLPKENT